MDTVTRTSLIAIGAEVIDLGGNEPIRLDKEPNVWLVESGKVEIFAVSVDPEHRGQRTHVTTIEAGRMLFGIQPQRQSSATSFLRRDQQSRATALIAVGLPETRLLKASIQSLVQLAREAEHLGAICSGVEAWLSDLFAKVPRAAAPKNFETVAAGDEVTLEGDGAARSASGVVWVRHITGESFFLGQSALPMRVAGFLLPLSDETWMTSTEGATVSCVGTENLIASGAVWEGLARFHELFLGYVDLIVGESRHDEVERLRRRQLNDRGVLGMATRRLASVLSQQVAPAADLTDGEAADSLLLAASWVGEQMGITIERPQNARGQIHHGHAIAMICAASRIRQRLVILRGDWWRRDNGPLLGFLWKEGAPNPKHRLRGKPVALLPTSATSYELADPATGERRAIDADIAATLEGEAFMFYSPLPERAVGLVDLVRLGIRGRRRDLLTLGAIGVATGLLSLLTPILTGHIFGTVVPAAERSQLTQMALALAVAAVAVFGFRLTRAVAILRLSGKLDGSVQAAVWDRLLALPVMFYKRFTVGDLLARSMGIDQIRTLILGNVATSFLDSISSILSLILLFYYSWRLALVAVTMTLVLVLVTAVIVWLQVRYQRRLLEMQGKLSSLVFNLLNGIQKLRGAGAEPRAFSLWAKRFGEMRKLTFKVRHLANGQNTFNSVFAIISLMAMFAAVHFWSEIELPVSDFLAFSAAFGQFQVTSLALISLLSSVLTMVPLYERLSPLLQTPPEVDASKAAAGDLSGDIELSHVSFRYDPNGPLILDDISIRARPGEFIALVGPSGSGKSTTLRLLLAFEQPEAGSIYYDGQDLAALDVQSVRRQMGVVLQNGQPMIGDIFTNIVGTSNFGMKEAIEAAEMAGLADDIKAMPMGMHTIISEEGGSFSGGQIQRLMIARAIVHRPRLLLFDEATSALDNRTQELVGRSLERLKPTRVVVAHRLTTVRHADRIYVLEKGRVTEQGSYDELMAMGGTFHRLATRQIS